MKSRKWEFEIRQGVADEVHDVHLSILSFSLGKLTTSEDLTPKTFLNHHHRYPLKLQPAHFTEKVRKEH